MAKPLREAFSTFLNQTHEKSFLVQLWVADNSANGTVLYQTSRQPYMVVGENDKMEVFRSVSRESHYSSGSGAPAVFLERTFISRRLEMTPDVQLFSSQEYPRLGHAAHCGIRASAAIPIFVAPQDTSQQLLGVVELVYSRVNLTIVSDIKQFMAALDSVGLCSHNITPENFAPNFQLPDPQLLNNLSIVISSVQRECNLPLLQSWVEIGSPSELVSTSKEIRLTAFQMPYAASHDLFHSYHQIASQVTLQINEGPGGQAFAPESGGYKFVANILEIPVTEFCLSLFARAMGLQSVFAFVIREIQTEPSNHSRGPASFVVEAYFPPRTEQFDLSAMNIQVSKLLASFQAGLSSLNLFFEIAKINVSNGVIGSSSMTAIAQTLTESLVGSHSQSQSCPPAISVEALPSTQRKERGGAQKSVPLEVIQQHFGFTIKEAASKMGLSVTTLKRICREEGIQRWPQRSKNFETNFIPGMAPGFMMDENLSSLTSTDVSSDWADFNNSSQRNQQGSTNHISDDQVREPYNVKQTAPGLVPGQLNMFMAPSNQISHASHVKKDGADIGSGQSLFENIDIRFISEDLEELSAGLQKKSKRSPEIVSTIMGEPLDYKGNDFMSDTWDLDDTLISNTDNVSQRGIQDSVFFPAVEMKFESSENVSNMSHLPTLTTHSPQLDMLSSMNNTDPTRSSIQQQADLTNWIQKGVYPEPSIPEEVIPISIAPDAPANLSNLTFVEMECVTEEKKFILVRAGMDNTVIEFGMAEDDGFHGLLLYCQSQFSLQDGEITSIKYLTAAGTYFSISNDLDLSASISHALQNGGEIRDGSIWSSGITLIVSR